MNIEEAKANIGKEVVYIGSSMPNLTNRIFKILGVFNGAVEADMDRIYLLVEHQELQLKQPAFKVGDQVVLDESTKPYTLTSGNGKPLERIRNLIDGLPYMVTGISPDGDIAISNLGYVQPRHLKLAPKLEINGKEIKKFYVHEECLISPELFKLDITEEDFKQFNMPCKLRKADPEYHSQEMRKYRDEVAQTLLANGIPFDENFKNKIDLYVNAVITK